MTFLRRMLLAPAQEMCPIHGIPLAMNGKCPKCNPR